MEILVLRNKIIRLKNKWLSNQNYEIASDFREVEKQLDKHISENGISI